MTLGTRLFTWLKGELVATDQFGNRYYRERTGRKLTKGGGRDSRQKRWVLYRGEAEASKVPAEWHAWLHHTTDQLPADNGRPKYQWQKPHLPNLTGTKLAYRPPGSPLKGGKRDAAAGDYEPWLPE
jgi:NADH:ubiquinone oxidoreductase subunit